MGSLDADQDGYTDINEIYEYALRRLRDSHKLTPQRSLEGFVGTARLTRALTRRTSAAAEPAPKQPMGEYPASPPISTISLAEGNASTVVLSPVQRRHILVLWTALVYAFGLAMSAYLATLGPSRAHTLPSLGFGAAGVLLFYLFRRHDAVRPAIVLALAGAGLGLLLAIYNWSC